MTVLYALQNLGYVIPPQAEFGSIGEAAPEPSYGDPLGNGPAWFGNEFAQSNETIMIWTQMHLARMLTDAGNIRNHGKDL